MLIKNDINRIFIMLGQQCNLSCDYCLQHDMIQDKIKINDINKDIFDFFKKNTTDHKIDVIFYGGEPLLYYDAIKYIATSIRPFVDHMGIISNGKNLTQDMVNFFNEMDIYFAVSWDGKNSKITRHYDAIEDKKDLLFQINHLGVNSVSSSMCYPNDFYKEAIKLSKEYGAANKNQNNKGLIISNELFMNTGTCKEYLSKIDYEKLNKQMKEVCNKAYEDLKNKKAGFYSNKFINTVDTYSKFVDGPMCGNPTTTLNMDLHGNLYECHNTWKKIGTIYDTNEQYKEETVNNAVEEYNAHCLDCEVKELCQGGCYLIPWEKKQDSGYCKYRKAYYKPMIDMLNKMVKDNFLRW